MASDSHWIRICAATSHIRHSTINFRSSASDYSTELLRPERKIQIACFQSHSINVRIHSVHHRNYLFFKGRSGLCAHIAFSEISKSDFNGCLTKQNVSSSIDWRIYRWNGHHTWTLLPLLPSAKVVIYADFNMTWNTPHWLNFLSSFLSGCSTCRICSSYGITISKAQNGGKVSDERLLQELITSCSSDRFAFPARFNLFLTIYIFSEKHCIDFCPRNIIVITLHNHILWLGLCSKCLRPWKQAV